MRKFLIVAIATLFVYVGSAAVAMTNLAKDVEKGNGTAVMARVDQPELRRSIVSQLLATLEEGREKPASPRSRFLTQAVGGTIADAMVNNFMTAANITAILKDGRVGATEQTPELTLNIDELSSDNIANLVERLRVQGIRRYAIRLSAETQGDQHSELLMEYQWSAWKIVGLRLPKSALRELIKGLPTSVMSQRGTGDKAL